MTLEDRYAALFAHATDTYLRQLPRGRGYVRVDAALTPAVFRRHLRGEDTIGLYLLDTRDTVRHGVLDHDGERVVRDDWGMPLRDETGRVERVAEDGLARLRETQERLSRQGIAAAVERSRRGAHLWIFAAAPVPARDMRALLLLAAEDAALEAYPKQNARGGGVGSAIRAPLGVHRSSGERYGFVGSDGAPLASTLAGQLDYLEGVRRVDVARELAARPHLRNLRDAGDGRLIDLSAVRRAGAPIRETRGDYDVRGGSGGGSGGGRNEIRAWVAGVRLEDIVRAYIPLSRGLVGRCPWPEHHRNEDKHPSFVVSARAQRWRCYASDEHGDAFDFVARMERHRGAGETLAYVRGRWPVGDPAPTLTRNPHQGDQRP